MSSFRVQLTRRLALLVTSLTVAVLLAGGLLLNHQIEHGLELLHDVEAQEIGQLLGDDTSLSAEDMERRISHDADSDAALFFIQVSRGDRIVFRSDNLGDTLLPTGDPAGRHWTTRLPFLGRVRLSTYQRGPWQIVLGSALRPSERLLTDYAKISLGLVLGVALLSVGLGYAFSRATLAPIRAIDATARRIRADNLGERIPVSGHDELAALARLLNETFDRLQASFEQVRRFSADASHELKTPLALVRLNAERLRPQLAADPAGTAALDDLLEEVARMHVVIERLLFIAKSESGALAITRRPLALAPWLASFAEDAQVLAEDRGAQFTLGDNAAGELAVDADLVRQMLLNLVTNAVAVSPAGGQVRLDSRPEDGAWAFTVTDEGPGLPPEQLARIFERFVRFPAGGAAAAERGHGLGLAICRAIADLHGGSIRAENRADRPGLRVTVTLPRA
ncbi:ATP-binding protein [Oleiharenicola sp. Vm1]|uniref:HAMP domain-containing sensor histidine kinase n=1 Tax=Oleiharenicola sp. Vm1 TaxID=3398393 RepID=UPI0039F46396